MDVTRKNFKEALPLVSDSIKKADFLVIDTEFTGLINGRDVTVFDTPEEYYLRTLNGCTDFLLIQFGLCAFYWDDDKEHYMNDAYNFYVFPRGRPGIEKTFLCQSSSVDFLASQGFDFNKLFRDGISYMTEPVETRLREQLTERQKLYSNDKDIIPIPEENKQQIEQICAKVRSFLDEKQSDDMEIDRCNAFIRRLLFQELGTRFKGEVFLETKVQENQNRILKVSRMVESRDHDAEKKEREWEELEDAVGFSKVARMISQSEKLVVGHNMLLDVIHTLNHFFQPLPPDYTSFKEFAHCMFPSIVDTKYMSSLPPFKDKVNSSVLQHLYQTLSEPPFSIPTVESPAGRGYSRSCSRSHEAGYDAYVTGLCFLAMYGHVSRMRGDPDARPAPPAPARPALRPFLHRLYLAKTAHQDSPYINLAGADPTPSREHVFHLTFPKEWRRNDIEQLFSPFGPIAVYFLDDTSAWVMVSRRERARDVPRLLAGARATLVPYTAYKHNANKPPQQQEKWRKTADVASSISTPDSTTRARQGVSAAGSSPPRRSRTVSATSPRAPPPARKRTSSGVFQVDDAEPPPKKVELEAAGAKVEAVAKRTDDVTKKTATTAEKIVKRKPEAKKTEVTQKKQVKNESANGIPNELNLNEKHLRELEKGSKVKHVEAFKESDSWD